MKVNFCMHTKLLSISVIKRTNHTKAKSSSNFQRSYQTIRELRVRHRQALSRESLKYSLSLKVKLGNDFITNSWRRITIPMSKSSKPSKNKLAQRIPFFMEQLFGLMQSKTPTRQMTPFWMTTFHGWLKQRTGIDLMQLLHLVSSILETARMPSVFWIHTSLELVHLTSQTHLTLLQEHI